MAQNTVFCVVGLTLCVVGGIISISSLATAHWGVIDNHVNVPNSNERVDMVQAYGLFVVCLNIDADSVGVGISDCSVRNYDSNLSKDLGTYIDLVRGLVITGLILCGVVGCIVIGASITACNNQQNKGLLLVSGALVALAGVLTAAGVIVYGTVAFEELKDTFEDAVTLHMSSVPTIPGVDMKELMRSLFNHELMKLSWSFYLCVAAGAVMLLAGVVLLVGSCYSSRNPPPGRLTPGVMYAASPPTTVIQPQPFFYGHPQPPPQYNAGYVPDEHKMYM